MLGPEPGTGRDLVVQSAELTFTGPFGNTVVAMMKSQSLFMSPAPSPNDPCR